MATISERFCRQFYKALDQFNAGKYFECHETLEALWIPETRPIRQVYQGIIQIAVGCYHLVNRSNYRGAVNKLNSGARKLDSWPDEMEGVKLALLIQQADRLRNHLIDVGPDRIREYDSSLLPKIEFTRDPSS